MQTKPTTPLAPGRQTIRFRSGDEVCDAWLYRPVPNGTPRPVPLIVMAHGLGGVKRVRLDAFAERFQAAGYACLVFDYRHFGDSTGEPRELLDIRMQLQDFAAAVGHARSLEGIDPDRIILWGTSFGGGHTIVTAAEDPRIAAAIAQCPFTDGRASARALDPITNLRVGAHAVRDLIAGRLGRPPVRVPIVGEPGEVALMTAPDAKRGYLALLEASGLARDEVPERVAARVALQIPSYRPALRARDVRCPLLLCVCDGDSVAPAKPTLEHGARAPRSRIVRYPYGHFEIYLGAQFEHLVADQLAFLRQHVPAADA